MLSAAKKVFYRNLQFNVTANVYEPAEDSFLFADNLTVADGDMVIDMGTGCGIIGVIAAAKANHVIAIDLNPHAVKCAEENAALNNVAECMSFIQGNLFAPIRIGMKFDVITFNSPYLPSRDAEGDSWLVKAWSGGLGGRRIIDAFIMEASTYLKSNGTILLMQSTLSDVKRSLREFDRKELKASIVAQQDVPFFETIVLLKAQFKT